MLGQEFLFLQIKLDQDNEWITWLENTSHSQPAVSGAAGQVGGGKKKNHLSLVWAIGSVGLIRMQAHQLCFYQVTSQLRDWLLPRRHGKGRGLCGGGICLILLCKEVW